MSTDESEGGPCGYQLTPISDLAKKFECVSEAPQFPPGLKLREKGVTKLGRKVAKQDGYCFPPNWVQVSSYHCEIKSEESGAIVVTDTSTNGTFVNNQRIPKHSCYPIREGDVLRLSIPPGNEPEKLLEYRLDRIPDKKRAAKPEVTTGSPRASPLEKRRRCASPNGREDPLQAMANMQRRNQELMDKLEASRKLLEDERARHGQVEAQLRAAEAQAKEGVEEQLQEERCRAETSMQGTIDSLKGALEKANERASSLEAQRLEEASARAEAEENLARLKLSADAKEQVLDRQLAQMKAAQQEAKELQEARDALEKQLLVEQRDGRTIAARLATLETMHAELLQQIELEKSEAALQQEHLKTARQMIAQQQASLSEAKAARAEAEAGQAELQKRLDQAVWQNERAEEGHQQALGTSALQRAYLHKVLGISRHLREARRAEEDARASADRAKEEADAALKAMQAQVLSALRSDLDASQLSLEEMEEAAARKQQGAAEEEEEAEDTAGSEERGGFESREEGDGASRGTAPVFFATQLVKPAAANTEDGPEEGFTHPFEQAPSAAAEQFFDPEATQLLDDSAMDETAEQGQGDEDAAKGIPVEAATSGMVSPKANKGRSCSPCAQEEAPEELHEATVEAAPIQRGEQPEPDLDVAEQCLASGAEGFVVEAPVVDAEHASPEAPRNVQRDEKDGVGSDDDVVLVDAEGCEDNQHEGSKEGPYEAGEEENPCVPEGEEEVPRGAEEEEPYVHEAEQEEEGPFGAGEDKEPYVPEAAAEEEEEGREAEIGMQDEGFMEVDEPRDESH